MNEPQTIGHVKFALMFEGAQIEIEIEAGRVNAFQDAWLKGKRVAWENSPGGPAFLIDLSQVRIGIPNAQVQRGSGLVVPSGGVPDLRAVRQ